MIALLCLVWTMGFSQKKEKTPTATIDTKQQTYQERRVVLDRALQYGDLAVATQATHDILALGNEFSHYRDSLALLYFQRAAWPQVIAVTSDILTSKPKELGPLELRAVAYQTIGRPKESLTDYEALFALTQSPYHQYEIAALQYTMRRLGECAMTLDALMQNPAIKDLEIRISTNQSQQSVPMKAACRNMAGVLLMDQGKRDEAKKAIEEALAIFPEFELAKNNLNEVLKP